MPIETRVGTIEGPDLKPTEVKIEVHGEGDLQDKEVFPNHEGIIIIYPSTENK